MRKLIVSTMASLDAVIENPQNWTFDYMSDEFVQYAREQLFATDMLVMGRLTYEGFSQAWSARAGSDDFADRINSLPKYVASRTMQEPLTWNSKLIQGDAAEAVARLKEGSGGYILQYGSGELTRTLLEHGLIDELRLLVYPVAVGTGQRLFESIPQTPMRLLETKMFSTGVVVAHYEPVKK